DASRSNRNLNPLLRGLSRASDGGLDPRPATGSPALASNRQAPQDGFYQPVAWQGAFRTVNWASDWTFLSDRRILSPAGGGNPLPPPAPASTPGTIAQVVATTPDLSTLSTALQAGGLVGILNGPGPFTLFAPRNSAIEALGTNVLNALLSDTNLLVDILTYHVFAGSKPAASLAAGPLVMVNGDTATVAIQNGTVRINNAAVVVADVPASNGVVHILDAVLLPPVEVSPLGISLTAAGKVRLSWTGQATLQASDTLAGTYTDVGNTSPVEVDPAAAARFYRLR
ncbi:MAG: fasciclin domain-containing protein, partial [Verrucomicrobiota bacterium]